MNGIWEEILSDIFKNTEDDTRWVSCLVACDLCKTEWAAVYPTLTPHEKTKLECPNCGTMTVFDGVEDA